MLANIRAAAENPTLRAINLRVLVLADISNAPHDEVSLVPFLVCANEFDVGGFVAISRLEQSD